MTTRTNLKRPSLVPPLLMSKLKLIAHLTRRASTLLSRQQQQQQQQQQQHQHQQQQQQQQSRVAQ
jgi:hypothetical protein